jgi:hypothetical protein
VENRKSSDCDENFFELFLFIYHMCAVSDYSRQEATEKKNIENNLWSQKRKHTLMIHKLCESSFEQCPMNIRQKHFMKN